MRRYFVIEITTTETGTATNITEKATIEDAKMLYHQILAAVYANKNVTFAICMVINDKLGFEEMERFTIATDEEQ